MWTPEDRAHVGDFGCGQALSDDQYRLIEPLIPPAKPGGRPGLPTRRRQSHVVPELKEAPPEDVFAKTEDAPDDTTAIETFTVADDAAAQQARSRMSAFQRGTAGGRSTN